MLFSSVPDCAPRRFLGMALLLSAATALGASPAAPTGRTNTGAAPLPAATASAFGLSASFDPCKDFYDYANAAWLGSAQIPPDRPRWGAFDELDKRTKAALLQILDDAARGESPPADSGSAKVVAFYRSGMDTAAVDRAGPRPLGPELARIEAIASRSDLMDEIARLHRMDIPAGFRFTITFDAKDSRRYLIEMYQGGLGLPDRDYYFRSDAKSAAQRAEYTKHVARLLALLGTSTEAARREADAITALETRLAKSSMTNEQRRDPYAVYHLTRVAELASLAPGIDWNRYLESLGATGFDEVNVAQPEFLRTFADAVRDVSLADWKAYLRWHLAHAAASKLSSAFEKENFAFYGAYLTGRKQMQPRNERVVEIIGGRFGAGPLSQAAGELYVAKRFSPEAKARALALVGDIKAALRERLREVDWMGEATREAALAKLDAMDVKIGYPDKWRDYSRLQIEEAPSFAGKWLAANEFEIAREIAMARKPVDRDEWFVSPHTVNAFYSPPRNAIVFPAGILQPPFFDPNRDDAMNYGAIGMVIAHEITHGFDDRGRQYDGDGNLHDWWTQDDAERYARRADLIVRQYAGYVGAEGLHLNGQLTLGENIADIGGLKLAYLALHRALQARPVGAIDGLSPEQRFFISFAQIWRAKQTPEFERLLINTDAHSPPRFRVEGPLAHMPEFAQAMACRGAGSLVRAASERAAIW